MELYAQILNYGIPFFLVLIIIEYLWSLKIGFKVNNAFDTLSSISSGYTNLLKDVLGVAIVIVSYEFMHRHFAVFDIKATWLLFVLAFILKDFAGYWSHRFEHVVNVFWNRHIIHHSSEEFNLSCALRQDISAIIGIFFFLYIPMAIVGVPPKVIAIVAPIQLFAQFWYHTRLIDKMGFLESFLVTPSHHRVHHAINKEYLDKNFSQIFIVWDKLFGTFQEELKSVEPVYGVTRAVKTYNPILINFQHLWLLIKDAFRAENWKDKFRIWFMPTGWRPKDVIEKYPVDATLNVYNREKYEVEASNFLKGFSFFQVAFHLLLILYLFNNIAKFEFADCLLYGGFLMISIFAYTSLMDKSKLALVAETLKVVFGFSLIYKMNGWFNVDQFLPGLTYLFGFYLIISFMISCYVLIFSNKDERILNS